MAMDDQGWVTCQACGGSGVLPHECFEDSCCCLDPAEECCDGCDGDGGWWE